MVKLEYFCNGDWTHSAIEHYWDPEQGPCPSKNELAKQVVEALLSTLCSKKTSALEARSLDRVQDFSEAHCPAGGSPRSLTRECIRSWCRGWIEDEQEALQGPCQQMLAQRKWVQ